MSGIWLIRHAQADAPLGVAVGQADPPLSEAGRQEASGLAEDLAERPLDLIISSDLKRARQTADIIASRHGANVEVAEALREIDFGSWEGRCLSDLWKEEPEAAAAWEADITCFPPSFGEPFEALAARVDEFWREFEGRLDGLETAVVAHRGSLTVLYRLLTGCSLKEAWQQPFRSPSATCVERQC
jgi:broad specificity phosphatase PhoE